MGIELTYRGDTYTAVRDNMANMMVTIGSTDMIANGENYKISAPYMYFDTVLMIPMKAMEKAFGIEIKLSESGDKFEVASNYTAPEYKEITSSLMTFTPGHYSVSYEINLPEDANINVMYRVTSRISWDVDTEESLYYRSAPAPQYIDGKWRGAFSTSLMDKYYGVKLTVNDEIYLKERAFKTTARDMYSYSEYVSAMGGLNIVPTYESLSYYYVSNANDCEIYFRKSGESEWEKAYKPYKDIYADTQQFRGSIVNLESGTEYEVKAVELSENGESANEYSEAAATWTDNPSIAQIINLSEIYSGGSLLLTHLNGSADGWIKVIGDESTPVIAEGNIRDAVLFDNSRYVIFENVTVIGGARNGINLTESCDNIRIINCDISGWGRRGIFDSEAGVHRIDGDTPNWDAAIRLLYTGSVTVERCYIHDPKGSANFWDGETYSRVHPSGPCGVYYGSSGTTVIRYNDFVGNDEHLFNDAIESSGNGYIGGGPGKNTDIYGNYIANGADDATELDGSQMNIRYFGNRIENFHCGVSTSANGVGPSYIFENQICDLHFQGVTLGGGIKAGGRGESPYFGKHYIFNNTIDNYGYGIDGIGYDGVSEYHIETRNNIFVSASNRAITYGNYADERDSLDYDLLWKDSSILSAIIGENVKYAKPVYVDAEAGNMRLAESSKGQNMATLLNNFTHGGDVGVYGNTNILFMPHRPINATADKYRVLLKGAEPTCVSVTFESVEDLQELKIDTTGQWLSIADFEVSNDRRTITAKIQANTELCKNEECFGAVMFRLDTGYSIPVWVGINNN